MGTGRFPGAWADTGITLRRLLRRLAECTSDSGQYDNYPRRLSLDRFIGRRPRLLRAGRPDVSHRLARFRCADRRRGHRAGPLGFNTAITATSARNEFSRRAAQDPRVSVSPSAIALPSSFHFGSGYTSRGKQRYVFTWNTSKFPDVCGCSQRSRPPGAHHGEPEALPAQRSSRLRRYWDGWRFWCATAPPANLPRQF